MIVGVGTDIVYVPRILAIWEKHGSKFLSRVFNTQEIQDSYQYSSYNMKVRHFAKRFAAKEAYVKALGIGFGHGIKMTDIKVCNNYYGKPEMIINSEVDFISKNHNIYLSMSDDHDYVVAFVILENLEK